jgi:cytochrome bd-type quinol oxidase subunit 2
MEKHIKIARAHRALSWFYLVLIVLFAILFFVIGKDGKNEAPIAGMIYFFVLFGVVFAAHHFIAKGARERKPWARVASIIVACLMLLGFPIGTLIGIYLLVNGIPSWENGSSPDAARTT